MKPTYFFVIAILLAALVAWAYHRRQQQINALTQAKGAAYAAMSFAAIHP